jgi:hypothetical protein
MKKIITNMTFNYVLLTIVLLSPIIMTTLFAQPGPPPPPPPPVGVPIDGGILLLLSGLAAYGAKKFVNK